MSIDLDKLFEVDNGIAPNSSVDASPVILADDSSPQGSLDAPLWSIHYRTNGEIWRKTSAGVNGWELTEDPSIAHGRNSISFFISDRDGEAVNTGSYEILSFKPVAGKDLYLPSITFIWGVVIEAGNNGTTYARLVDRRTGDVIGESSTTMTEPTLVTLDVTANMKNGVRIYELQTKRNGSAGKIYSSGFEVTW